MNIPITSKESVKKKKKTSNKQKFRTKCPHRWILPNIQVRVFIHPSHTIPKNRRGGNACDFFEWGQHHPDIKTSGTTLYIIMVGTCHYTFVQTHRMYTTKSEPWSMGIIMGQYRFIDCNKCPLWWRMLIIGVARHVWGQKIHGKSCTSCLILLWTWSCFKKKIKSVYE